MSETAKYRHLVEQYLVGDGLDLGCGPELVVPHAIGMDLPPPEYEVYAGHGARSVATIHGDARHLPFLDETLDFVYSSHLLEDFKDWNPILREWVRVLKPGGHLVIIIPDRTRFAAAVAAGQPPNLNHQHEGRVGELSEVFVGVKPWMRPIVDQFTDLHPGDYSILFVARRIS